jgi:adenosine deaminase
LLSDFSFNALAKNHLTKVKNMYEQAAFKDGRDSLLAVRFLNYAVRVVPPTDVFAQLALSFLATDGNLALGVNIVAPEDNEVSMADYWLHMQFFKYLHSRLPDVKYSLHAGELTLGLVKPEELTWHIREAVFTAGANRIGHGVDLAYESEAIGLLDSMRARNVAIEINLTSNEFILGVKDDRHPLSLYFDRGVPITISTDDAGVLRTNHTEEFVLLASRYRMVKYRDIKKFVYNSIDFSFMNAVDKVNVRKRLDNAFYLFERKIAKELK